MLQLRIVFRCGNCQDMKQNIDGWRVEQAIINSSVLYSYFCCFNSVFN